MLLDALTAVVHTVTATYSKSAGNVFRRQSGAYNFKLSRLVGVLRSQSTRGTVPRVPRVIGQDTASINGGTHKVEVYLLLVTRLVATQIPSGFVLLRNLSWANLLLTLHIALHSKLSTSFESTSSKSA